MRALLGMKHGRYGCSNWLLDEARWRPMWIEAGLIGEASVCWASVRPWGAVPMV